MDIVLNNKPHSIEERSSLHDLLKNLKLNPDNVVTELNLKIIKKDKRKDTTLKKGDRVEIITFMGGG